MFRNLNNKFSMYVKVQDHLRQHAAEYETVRAIGNAKTELGANLLAIYDAGNKLAGDKGADIDTSFERIELELVMLKVVSALRSYTIDANKYLLSARVSYSLKELNMLSDSELLLKAKKLLEIATPKIDRLGYYQVTMADLYHLHNQRDIFHRSVADLDHESEVMTVPCIELEALFYATDILLRKLDDYMLNFQAERPVLWKAYQSVRLTDGTSTGVAHDYEGAMSPGANV